MTLETAKLLKENGWDKETEKVWCETWNNLAEQRTWDIHYYDENDKVNPQIFSPSLEELLAVMPDTLRVKQDVVLLVLAYLQREITDLGNELALLWIKLKKEELIT